MIIANDSFAPGLSLSGTLTRAAGACMLAQAVTSNDRKSGVNLRYMCGADFRRDLEGCQDHFGLALTRGWTYFSPRGMEELNYLEIESVNNTAAVKLRRVTCKSSAS